MKKWYFLFVLVGMQLTLVGCSTQTTPVKEVQEKTETQRLMIVSSGKPSKVLPAFTTYSWSEEYNQVLSSVAGQNQQEFKSYIRDQIKAYLSTKGYEYKADPKQANVVVGFLFALEDAIADRTVQERFGLLPGLRRAKASDPRYEKGSLLLTVLDNQQKTIYWRSAVQGFVDLEKDRVESGSTRMKGILNMMLRDFPEAGQ
ncbi:DUF4136 domain-containing protein [Psychromonas sp. SP041]|uniref:DUF4136 domain-containing protein n=1 Tax=Psychromonas sp. SP041 TaxID=1365007 RepID=UPI0003FEF799|nr:DUF4136 domain-containing protein [Psychromonas sp. SP041]